jgi:hypothetical protein
MQQELCAQELAAMCMHEPRPVGVMPVPFPLEAVALLVALRPPREVRQERPMVNMLPASALAYDNAAWHTTVGYLEVPDAGGASFQRCRDLLRKHPTLEFAPSARKLFYHLCASKRSMQEVSSNPGELASSTPGQVFSAHMCLNLHTIYTLLYLRAYAGCKPSDTPAVLEKRIRSALDIVVRDEFLQAELTRVVEFGIDELSENDEAFEVGWASHEEAPYNHQFVRNSVQLIREVTLRNWFFDLRKLMNEIQRAALDLSHYASSILKEAEARRLGGWWS